MDVGLRGGNSWDQERVENGDPTPTPKKDPKIESMKEMLRRVLKRDVDFDIVDELSGIPKSKRKKYMQTNTVYNSEIGMCVMSIFSIIA